jgi:hypothetical protein
MNRSVDPTDAGGQNHVMENIMFRPRWGQWIAAPDNHVAGPIKFDFDFYLHDWSNFDTSAPTMMIVTLYGLNFTPPHNVTFVDDVPGHALSPLGAEPADAQSPWNTAGLDGVPLVHFRFNFWMRDYVDYFDQWNHISSADPDNPLWDAYDGSIITTELTQTYNYYAMTVYSAVYAEGHPYAWLYGGKTVDTPALLWDNFNLQLSVGADIPPAIAALNPGDFNLDGVLNRCRHRRCAASATRAASSCSCRSATAPTCGRCWRWPTRSPARRTRRPG